MFQVTSNENSPGKRDLTLLDGINNTGESTSTFIFDVSMPDELESTINVINTCQNISTKIQYSTKELQFFDDERSLTNREIKPHSTPATLLWLGKNYELAEGICIPRNTLYSHYVHFCNTNFMSPLNSASFGKIIRQAFPSLTTRRLGTRGQSQYHYCGVAIKENSPYYETAFSKMIFSCNDGKKTLDKNSIAIILTKRKENLKVWPSFPNVREIPFPPHVSEEKIKSFIIMYHTHCQRIFDTIVRGSLEDVYQFFEHFWQGVPSHLSDLLNTNAIINMVGVCDSILYRTISNVLMPNVIKRGSENLINIIRNFADKLENWINSALSVVPQNLKTVKLKLSKRFCTILRRQMLLYQLTHTAHVVLNNCEMMSHINRDWKRISLGPITRQALLFADHSNDHVETINHIKGYWKNFQGLIERQAAIEDFIEIVETIVRICIVEMSEKKKIPFKKVARTFMLLWHLIESLISRDMTIHSAASFGSFHLIQTMFNEYMHYLVEMLRSEDVTKYFLRNITLDVLPNLDSNWNDHNDSICVDLFETATITNITGQSLEGIPDDLQNTGFSFYTSGTDYNVSKNNDMQNEYSLINNHCEYPNIKEKFEAKYHSFTSFSEAISLPELDNCEPVNNEFSTGIYCQEALQYNSNNIQYQSNDYSAGSTFECLE